MNRFDGLSKEEEQRALDLHRKAIVIEGHTHGMSDMEKVLPSIQEGGVTGRILDLSGAFDRDAFLKTSYPETVIYNYEGWAKRFMVQVDKLLPEFDKHSDKVSMAFSAEDFLKAKENAKIAILLGLEGGLPLEGRLEVLRTYYRLGLRSMQLTWCWRNQLSDACFEATNSGLTDFGKDVVREMNKLGMIVGTAHITEKGFFDTLEISKDPIVVSHAMVRALCGDGIPYFEYNLSDEQIMALAENKGVMGTLNLSSHGVVLCTERKI
ncbi:MAG: dipeptidase, partial [Candidatus Hodarchaeota archaeon]